jgi:ABC-type dipeptide/oligopeptide/nickel transport system permease subunit
MVEIAKDMDYSKFLLDIVFPGLGLALTTAVASRDGPTVESDVGDGPVHHRKSARRHRRHSAQSTAAADDMRAAPGLTRMPVLRGLLLSRSGCVGLFLAGAIVALALCGPLLTPYSPIDTLAMPYELPTMAHPLGADSLGRDALARYLYGGRTLVIVALLATVLAYLVGLPIGMLAGYCRGIFDLATIGAADLVLSFPAIIFILVLVAGLGPDQQCTTRLCTSRIVSRHARGRAGSIIFELWSWARNGHAAAVAECLWWDSPTGSACAATSPISPSRCASA